MNATSISVASIMNPTPHTCRPDQSLADVAQLMWEQDVGFLPVVDALTHQVSGVITDRDLAMAAWMKGLRLADIHVTDAMARQVLWVHPEDDVSTATSLMKDHQVRRLPVVDAGQHVVGVVTLADLAHASPRSGRIKLDTLDTLGGITQPRAAPPEKPRTLQDRGNGVRVIHA